MIHVPEEQTQQYLRQKIIMTSISYNNYNYYYYYYYYYYYTIIHNLYKINKPHSMCKVSHLQ